MKNIILYKNDAVAYFGSINNIADAIGISQAAISGAGDILPASQAWPLYYVSKLRKNRYRPKLEVKINIE